MRKIPSSFLTPLPAGRQGPGISLTFPRSLVKPGMTFNFSIVIRDFSHISIY
jgi:hypothetical protein